MTDARSTLARLLALVKLPFADLMNGLERCLLPPADEPARGKGYRELALVAFGLAVGWWIYVPLHELLHAAGCLVTGGSVSRLEIAELYGGALLERLVPFVTAGGDYAGRLSGFDTGGSDAVYLATVAAPFVLTLFPGVWGLRRGSRTRNAFVYGFFVPVAAAPFVSLPGDAYEIGSIVTTWLPPWSALAETLRGDDVFLLASQLGQQAGAPWGGFVFGIVLGLLWAFVTYALAAAVATLCRQPPFD